MKNIVGSPARGATFLKRQGEIEKIINRLQNGNNIQIAAPRRIGKTSILFYLLDNEVKPFEFTADKDIYTKQLDLTILKTAIIT